MIEEKALLVRSESKCELCTSSDSLAAYQVSHSLDASIEEGIIVCGECYKQIQDPEQMDSNHWRCLNDSMWSQVPAVQVMAWRILMRLKSEGWPQDLLDMLYLEEGVLSWAKASTDNESGNEAIKHFDSNGALLEAGDTVTLIKDLNVKGANFTAKRGTSVRGISLDSNNSEHIEGRVEGQKIVILTKFVKKSN